MDDGPQGVAAAGVLLCVFGVYESVDAAVGLFVRDGRPDRIAQMSRTRCGG